MTERPTLDAALAAWATTEPAGAGDDAALARILQHAETIATQPATSARPATGRFQPKPGWMLGGALAASFAIALLLAPDPRGKLGADEVVLAGAGDVEGGSVRLAEADGSTSAAFALLYTPTVEEEYQL
jgi:hypothetical protein